MHVDIDDRQSNLPISHETLQDLVQAVVAFEGQNYDEVGIHFVEKDEISRLHAQFFQDPSPTDCISFPIDNTTSSNGEFRLMGDVFVCPQVAVDYAAANQGNPYEEVTLYVIHGLLHLMGYNDIEDSEIEAMRVAEKRHMQHLKRSNLWLHP
jgi:probable rRNA maturation factor